MISLRRVAVAVLLSLVCLAASPAASTAQEEKAPKLAMRFEWPASSEAEVTHRRFVRRESGSKVDSTENRWRFRLRMGPDGDRRRVELTSLRREGDAARLADAVGSSTPIATLVVDASGNPKDLLEVEALLERLRMAQPRSGAKGVAGAVDGITKDVVTTQLLRAWANLVSFWSDGDLEVESQYTMKGERDVSLVPGVRVPSKIDFGAVDRLACSGSRADTSCVHLAMIETPDEDELAKLVPAFLEASGFAKDGPSVEDVDYSRRIDLVTEPWTLLPTRMTVRTTVTIAFREGKGPVRQVSQTEIHEFRFRFTRPRSPLHAAVVAGNDARVTELLDAKPRVDVADADGFTPLYSAASMGRESIAKLLVRADADARVAERLARARGDLGAMRVLRTVARIPSRRPPTFEAAKERFDQGDFPEATNLFSDLALAESTPGRAHVWLADALVHGREDSLAVRHAESVIAGDSCNTLALRVLRTGYDPLSVRGTWTSRRKADDFAQRLTRCAPTLGDGWVGVAWMSARRGDVAAEDAALRRVSSLKFFSDAQRAFGRWMLEHLPQRAVLAVNGDTDYLTLRMLQVEGVRADVALVETGALEGAAYARTVRDRLKLPLPVADAALDSIEASDQSLAAMVGAHWRKLSRSGALGRPLALVPAADEDYFEGTGEFRSAGPFRVLADTGTAGAVDPLVVWPRFRAVPVTLRGTPTRTDDPEPRRRVYDVGRDVLVPAGQFVEGAGIEDAKLSAAQIDALDSIVTWVDRRSEGIKWSSRDEFLADLGTSVTSLADRRWRAGDRAGARRLAELAARLAPESPRALNAAATAALLRGRYGVADSLLRRAREFDPGFDVILNAALTARLMGRPDSSLALLVRTQEMVDGADEETRADVRQRILTYLPRTSADTTGTVKFLTVSTFAELASLVAYHAALGHAMREEITDAEAAMTRARGLSASEPMRCFVANLLQSTRAATRLKPKADEWFRQQEGALRCTRP